MKTSNNEDILRKIYQNKFINELKLKVSSTNTASPEALIQNFKDSEKLGLLGNTIALISKRDGFVPTFLYVSNNIEKIFGYKITDVNGRDISALLEVIDMKQLNFAMLLLDWNKNFEELKQKKGIKGFQNQNFYCGLKAKMNNSTETKIACVRHIYFNQNDHAFSNISIFLLDEITHLYKGDFFWAHLASFDEDEKIQLSGFYTSTEDYNKPIPKTILSKRETEILSLIASGMDTKEIGKALFISTGTVEQHRKKMIAKSGVRDTIALIEIAKKSKLLYE